ncbi:hypothetical protein ALC57_06333 [Trachymyrmex cornetzi]|uniref:Uncharacterized protein n=1 Tax=Trachymyrmex cornetzi TaxID=471704 RepID=A0A195E9B5_9HYME|nr:hypothetical protein ALC57_06333 [Trachymyrmex cornetzi]
MCISVRNTYETYVKRRMRDRKKEEERDPVHYTPHNVVVQTPWARRTAFQGGSMDMAHDGVRGSRQEEEKEEEDEEEEEEGKEETEGSVWKVKEREREGGEGGKEPVKEREEKLGNNSIKRRTPSN